MYIVGVFVSFICKFHGTFVILLKVISYDVSSGLTGSPEPFLITVFYPVVIYSIYKGPFNVHVICPTYYCLVQQCWALGNHG